MSLPWPAQAFLWLLVCVAGGALWWSLGAWPESGVADGSALGLLALLGTLAVVAQHLPVLVGPQRKVNASMAMYFTAVLLFELPVAVVMIGGSQLVGQSTLALRRDVASGKPLRSVRSILFNTSQLVLTTVVGGLVYGALRPRAAEPLEGVEQLWAVPATAAAMYLANTMAVALMVGLQKGQDPLEIWHKGRRADVFPFTVLFFIGLIAALTSIHYPWAPLLMAVPAVGVCLSLRRIVELLASERLAAQRLLEQSRTLARLGERERIAMDMHDGVIQSLYALSLSLGAQARTLSQTGSQAGSHPGSHPGSRPDGEAHWLQAGLEEAISQLDTVIQDLRGYILDLRPEGTSAQGLRPGIELLAEGLRLSGSMGVELECSADVDGLLDDETGASVLHVVREAIGNVVRHAAASRVTIRLAREGATLLLIVRDNGQGFDARRQEERQGREHHGREHHGREHHGLRNMAERARLLGGGLTVTSRRGHGTEVCLTVPLPPLGGVSGHVSGRGKEPTA